MSDTRPAPRAAASATRARLRLAPLALLALALVPHAAFAAAASLEDYRARVGRAAGAVRDVLAAGADEDEGLTEAEFDAWAAGRLAEARASLPARERVEWAGGAAEVDNGWLHRELDGWAAAEKSEEKTRILSRVSERLGELGRSLDEAAGASRAARDKEAEKGRLQTILRRPEYNEEASKGTAFQQFWERLARLLRRLMPRRSPVSGAYAGLLNVIARVLVFGLAVALIVFLVVRYAPGLWARAGGRRRGKSRGREARVVLGERIEADQSAADLIEEAERLARAGDVRGAIRKSYVAVLCELGDRKLIGLARHKTNRDYLNALRERAPLYELMRPLTHNFERHWYGFAPATDSDWDAYRRLCREALSG